MAVRLVGLAVLLLVARAGAVAAFPFLDATNADPVPQGSELAAQDVLDMQHQLSLVNGLSAPPGGGWTIVPRIDWQEELTDNVLQQHSSRRADLVTLISPGISVAGDLPRARIVFDFAPTLSMYTRTGDLNSLTEQMYGLGNIILIPDWAYVDARVLAGVQNLNGGLGGLGTTGAPAGAAAQPLIPNLAGSSQGLNKNNEVQTTSFGISPYLLRRLGDWGTAKLGYSLDVTQSSALSGFASAPFPTGGGANTQTLVTNEEIAHFATGEFMQYFQNSFDIDLQQGQTTAGAGVINVTTGSPLQATQNTTYTRNFVSDRVNYVVSRGVSVFASGGHEDINYTGFARQSIHDLTWSLGSSLTPNPNSLLTVSYGHLDGFNSFTVSGYYAPTARTQLTVSYGSTLGTQLQNIQNQFNLAGSNANGTLVNSQNGAQLFGANNALGVQSGIYRTTTLQVGSQTTLDRDILSINLLLTKQTSSGNSIGFTQRSTVANVTWLHQMRPDVLLSAGFSYAIQDQSSGVLSAANPGNNTSIVSSLALQWQLSENVSASVQYAFFERQSAASDFDFYQNALILGLAKRF